MANLSKSKYITYCQCPKALWLKQYKSEEMVIDPLTQARFDAGSEVGELAKRLFGDFVEVTAYKTAADKHSASTSERWLQPHRKPLPKVRRTLPRQLLYMTDAIAPSTCCTRLLMAMPSMR